MACGGRDVSSTSFAAVIEQAKSTVGNRPRIAVIIPAYNAAAYIAETIQSVLNQTRPADEIVVVDDGSTDETPGVVAGFRPQVKAVRQQNAGEGCARKRGVDITTSDLLLFLDADDVLADLALEKLSDALEKQPSSALAFCPALAWSPTNPALADADPWAGVSAMQDVSWDSLLMRNFIRTPGCVLMRRTALNNAGGWDADDRLRGNADWELWLRLAEAHPFAMVSEPLLKYRLHDDGLSRSRPKMYRSMFRLYRKQRLRWRCDPDRQLLVETAEWHKCKFVMVETRDYVRFACSKGRFFLAVGRLVKVVPAALLPIINSAFKAMVRHLVRSSGVA